MKIIPFLLAFGLAISSLAAPGAVRAAEPVVDDGDIVVVAAPAFDGVLGPASNLILSGTVTNTSNQTAEASVATVFLGNATSSRRILNRWLDPAQEPGALGRALGSVAIGELAPGQLRSFTVTVPSATLALTGSSFASFPVAVELSVGNVAIGLARTAVVWNPIETTPTLNLAIAMPVITPPSTSGILTSEELAQYTAPDGVLTRQLDAALSHTVAIGIDPMIIASIRLLGTSAPSTALDWLTRLSFAPNDTFALSYADHDISLVSQAGVSAGLLPLAFNIDPSLFPEEPDPSSTPVTQPASITDPTLPTQETVQDWDYTLTGLSWPDDGTVVAEDLANFVAAGTTRTIVSSLQLNPAPSATPNARVGDSDILVSDSALSDALRTAANATTDLAWKQALAALVAELAATASGANGATLLATLGRDGSVDGPRLASTLTALEGLPWVNPTTLGDAVSVTAAAAKLVDAPEPATRVATVESMISSRTAPSERRVTAFASILADPTLLTGPRRLALLATLSQSWHADQTGWNDAAKLYTADNDTILASVHIPDSSTINLLQEKSNLPIAVMNELDFPVTVYVNVQPDRAILRVTDSRVELTIEPNSQAKAFVPVESIANGEVRTTVSLSSASNVRIDSPTVVDLNVQAGWETAATFVSAAVVVVLFGAGIWRTVLRRRKLRSHPESSDS